VLPEIVLTDDPEPSALGLIGDQLNQFNTAAAGVANGYRALAILLTDPNSSAVIGGLSGWTTFEQLYVHLLFIPESCRGQGLGRTLMQKVECEAIERGCRGAWLDTFSFQARGFYEKLGYTVFGSIDNYPPGHSRFFLKKVLQS